MASVFKPKSSVPVNASGYLYRYGIAPTYYETSVVQTPSFGIDMGVSGLIPVHYGGVWNISGIIDEPGMARVARLLGANSVVKNGVSGCIGCACFDPDPFKHMPGCPAVAAKFIPPSDPVGVLL